MPALALALLLACGTEPRPEPQPEPTDPPMMALPVVEAPAAAVPASGGSVPVELRFFGVGGLHQGFFRDERALGGLAEALGTCLTETAQVVVTYDAEERVGRLYLKVPPEAAAACLPRVEGSTVDLAPLVPIGVALADYRDRVAASFDFRIASFKVGASFTRGASVCTLWAAGSHPPDGRQWGRCIQTGQGRACGAGEDGVTTIALSEADARYVRGCFRR